MYYLLSVKCINVYFPTFLLSYFFCVFVLSFQKTLYLCTLINEGSIKKLCGRAHILIKEYKSVMEVSSYRPRNAGHDYYGRGTYLITLVVSGRESPLSRFVTDVAHGSPEGREHLALTPLGEAVQEAWQQIPARQITHGNHVAVHACVCMPDHFHGVIEVLEPMSWSLGDIIQAFKAFCTSCWQQGLGLPTSVNRPISADCRGEGAPDWLRAKAAMHR